MIIFINGPFGVGKTETARLLNKTLDNSLIFDPEDAGQLLKNVLNDVDPKNDFQEYDLWPTLTIDVAKRLKEKYQRALIIPMTVYNNERFQALTDGLKNFDADFHHFCLLCNEKLLKERLLGRGEKPESWGFQHIHNSLKAYESSEFEQKIITDNKDVGQAVEHIIKSLGRQF